MEELLARYGLVAILIGTALEGDVTMLLAGVVAHLGYVDFPAAIAVGGAGAMTSDCAFFTAGRKGGVRLRQTSAYARAAPLIEGVVRRVGPWELAVARFVFGTRTASMVFWGIHGLPWGRFLAIDLIGCAAWALVLSSLGYAFSGSAALLLGEVKEAERWLAGALGMACVVVLLARRLTRRLPHG